MLIKQQFKPESPSLEYLPTEEELEDMVRNNQIVDFTHHLRRNYEINYRDLLDTAKKLKTIDQQILKQASRYFNPEDEGSCSSEEDSSPN